MMTRNSCALLIVLYLIVVLISRIEGTANVDTFVKTFQNIVHISPKLQDAMRVADMDPDKAAKEFSEVVQKELQNSGNPRADHLAKELKVSVKETIGLYGSCSYPTILGLWMGNILEDKGLLKHDNAGKLANDLASAVLLVINTSDSSTSESYIQGIMQGSSDFCTALGVSFFGDFPYIVKHFEEAVKSVMKIP